VNLPWPVAWAAGRSVEEQTADTAVGEADIVVAAVVASSAAVAQEPAEPGLWA
jgi:hypothetical protein